MFVEAIKGDPTNFSLPVQQKVQTKPEALFDKIVVKKDEKIPDNLDIEGCVCITRDTKHSTFLHALIWIVQKIHNLIFGKTKTCDANLVHGQVILHRDEREGKKNNLVCAHSDAKGVRTYSWNRLEDDHITEMVIYRPKSEALRQLIIKHANQTAHNPKAKNTDKKIKRAKFATFDMIGSFFRKNHKSPAPSRGRKRTATIVADLLLDKQISNHEGKPQRYFCNAYMMAVLQGSYLISGLSKEYKEELTENGSLDRKALAEKIYQKFRDEKKQVDDELTKAYWNQRFARLDARYLMSCYSSEALDEVSEELIR